ncbi:hypothetical protein ACS0TY_017539 [Phlomoides rotata]
MPLQINHPKSFIWCDEWHNQIHQTPCLNFWYIHEVAYISHGEPLYDDLKKLFAPELLLEEEENVIIISDGDEDVPSLFADVAEDNVPNAVDLEDDVEVVVLSDDGYMNDLSDFEPT